MTKICIRPTISDYWSKHS